MTIFGRSKKQAIARGVAGAAAAACFAAAPALANPVGGQVAAGSATITAPSATDLQILQSSPTVIINWSQFNIGAGETTRFVQPDAHALAVNRVGGQDPSRILGSLQSNGRVMLINGNGVVFGAGAQVNTSSFIATTADAADADLMSGKANFSTGAGAGMIDNAGAITAAPGGLVALIAPAVNNSGVITARLGSVVLGAASKFTLDFTGDGLISFPADADVLARAVDSSGNPVAALIANQGVIQGGHILLSAHAGQDLIARTVSLGGTVIATDARQDGGDVILEGAQGAVDVGGDIQAAGKAGGSVSALGKNILLDGQIDVSGSDGSGGTVSLDAAHRVIATQPSSITANGTVSGGVITVSGGYDANGGLFSSAGWTATASIGVGGSVGVQGGGVDLYGAALDVSGGIGGGRIAIGGGLTGDLVVAPSTRLIADATLAGDGGTISLLSQTSTVAYGVYSARGGALGGDGGQVEASSLGAVTMGASIDTGAPVGHAGTLLLDPRNLVIDDTLGQFPQYDLPDPDPAPGNTFGIQTLVLDNGNVAIASPQDNFAGTGAGTVYLFNKNSGALISSLTGSGAGDQAGSQGFVKLANDNYLIVSAQWNSWRGAVTWASASAGVSGAISSANSLVGNTANDAVGASGYVGVFPSVYGAVVADGNVFALPNGNYVIDTPSWNNGAATLAGAVTLGNGSTGTSGVISAATSLVGTSTNDQVGYEGILLLKGPNASDFVVMSRYWNNVGAGATNAGAATWINGSVGLTGPVSAANSLVGTHADDMVGARAAAVPLPVLALSNGDYVIGSPHWSDGVSLQVGAATWGDGSAGVVGPITSSNSLVGSTANDQIARDDIYETALGDYVVASSNWNTTRGAVTWARGDGSTVGVVTAANSLVGDHVDQFVGSGIEFGAGASVVALPSGNYVVISSSWSPGGFNGNGAVTWASKDGSTVGAVSSANSLVGGSLDDQIGSGGVTVLTNGNYVVNSPEANLVDGQGAVTWGNGATGMSGVVSSSNSLVGGTNVGTTGWDTDHILALPDGDYLVANPNWNYRTGAVTLGNGSVGTAGVISSANSLTGSTSTLTAGSDGDQVGLSLTLLPNGNVVVDSPYWNNGAAVDAGAVTVVDPSGPVTGVVTAANSLVGTKPFDEVGFGDSITVLTNGNFVVGSPYWSNNGVIAGAATWANKDGSTVGPVSIANSVVGSTLNDQVGAYVQALANGNYVLTTYQWSNGGNDSVGAVTWGNGNGGTVGVISAANSLIGASANDYVGSVSTIGNDYLVTSPYWNNGRGAVTFGNGAVGTTGVVSAANSVIGATPGAILSWTAPVATGSGDFVVANSGDGGGRVVVGFSDLSQITFARAASLDLAITATSLANILNGGTNVTVQANNDITLGTALTVNNPLGNGGNLTLQAGRSILLNANITTDNGALTLLANAPLSAGVIDAQRLAGLATIAMGTGTVIDTGSGALTISLSGDATKTNHAAGGITLGTIDPSSILIEDLAGGDITLNGALTATGSGSSIVIGTSGNFINNVGAGALDPGPGRYVIYSQSPLTDVLGGLTGSPYYNTPYDPAHPGVLAASGDRFAYVLAPSLTVTVNGSRVYGDTTATPGYSIAGLVGSDAAANAISGAAVISSAATVSSPVGSYALTAAIGTLTSDYNYGFTLSNGALSITPAALTVSVNNAARAYGDANPAFSALITGFKLSDTASLVSGLTFATSAAASSNAGAYAITASGGTVAGGNYTIAAYHPGVLTITPAVLVDGGGSSTGGGSGGGKATPHYGRYAAMPFRMADESANFVPCFCPSHEDGENPFACFTLQGRCVRPCDCLCAAFPGGKRPSPDALAMVCLERALQAARRQLAADASP